MSELSVYERLADPLAAVKSLGQAIAKSRIFGCESEAQGEVLAWECLARRTPPLQLKETYHLINTGSGTALTMRADAMLAGFIQAGGRHVIVQRDGDAAEVELTIGGQSQRFRCTFGDCEDAGITEGKNGTKDNWSSPRQRMQMLWARVVSDGVRAMAPQVCAGKYTPEDFGRTIEQQTEPAIAGPAAGSVEIESATVVSPDKPRLANEPGTAKEWQRTRIGELFDVLQASPESRDAILRKRGVSSVRSLSASQADELLEKLGEKIKQIVVTEESKLPKTATAVLLTGPCSQGQIDLAKQLIGELEQMKPGTAAKVKAKLQAAGMSKLSDLSMADADNLLAQLGSRNIEEFFAASLMRAERQAEATAETNQGN